MKMHIVNKLQQMKDLREYGTSQLHVDKAHAILEELAGMITPVEWQAVQTAHVMVLTGQGTVQLHQVCNSLMQKYRKDIDPRTFTQTRL